MKQPSSSAAYEQDSERPADQYANVLECFALRRALACAALGACAACSPRPLVSTVPIEGNGPLLSPRAAANDAVVEEDMPVRFR